VKPISIFFTVLILSILFVSASFTQDDVSAELTPEAINARIAAYRMGDIIIETKPDAEIKIEQIRHEFLFGTAIPNSLAENSSNPMSPEDRKMYLKILKENFNYAVHENALKWYDCEVKKDSVDYSVADRIWEMCNELNIPMRGHCIFWAKEKYAMDWQKKLNYDELHRKVLSRAMDVTRHFKGRITEFDLNNEMINGDFFRRRFGYGIINEMALAAKVGNPDVKLCVNDYEVLVEGDVNDESYITQAARHIPSLLMKLTLPALRQLHLNIFRELLINSQNSTCQLKSLNVCLPPIKKRILPKSFVSIFQFALPTPVSKPF
jgi:hypothetical protein